MTLWSCVPLTALYVVAVGSFTAWDVLAGAGISALLLVVFRHVALPDPGERMKRHPFELVRHLLHLVPAMAWEFGLGTARVWRALWRPGRRPGLVEVPIEERSAAAVALSGFLASLAPDEFLVDVDWSRRVMLFHVVDAHDPDEIRRRHAQLYERYVAPLLK
jgi:multisubunit Na+/H+ antiporter MnhE subunit